MAIAPLQYSGKVRHTITDNGDGTYTLANPSPTLYAVEQSLAVNLFHDATGAVRDFALAEITDGNLGDMIFCDPVNLVLLVYGEVQVDPALNKIKKYVGAL